MISAQVTFGARRRNDPDLLENVAHEYLASLLHAGQLGENYHLFWTKGLLKAYAVLAGPGALAPRHHSVWGSRALRKIVRVFGGKPNWRLLDDRARESPPAWKGVPFLFLFTHAFDEESPVCRGDGGPPIPAFLLPFSFEQKQDLRSWKRSYYHYDHIWLEGGALELATYRQLADPNSELAQQGRKLGREIEAATHVPTFYFLMRYWARPRRESDRLCPGCGARWRAATTCDLLRPFWRFDFKCDSCRLVSHEGVSTDGKWRARIGEWRRSSFHAPG